MIGVSSLLHMIVELINLVGENNREWYIPHTFAHTV